MATFKTYKMSNLIFHDNILKVGSPGGDRTHDQGFRDPSSTTELPGSFYQDISNEASSPSMLNASNITAMRSYSLG